MTAMVRAPMLFPHRMSWGPSPTITISLGSMLNCVAMRWRQSGAGLILGRSPPAMTIANRFLMLRKSRILSTIFLGLLVQIASGRLVMDAMAASACGIHCVSTNG